MAIIEIEKTTAHINISVPELGFEDDLFKICMIFCKGVKEVGWAFRKMYFSIPFCEQDIDQGKVKAESILEKLKRAYKEETMKKLNPRDVNDPECTTPCLRTSPDKFYIWEDQFGGRFIINAGNY